MFHTLTTLVHQLLSSPTTPKGKGCQALSTVNGLFQNVYKVTLSNSTQSLDLTSKDRLLGTVCTFPLTLTQSTTAPINAHDSFIVPLRLL